MAAHASKRWWSQELDRTIRKALIVSTEEAGRRPTLGCLSNFSRGRAPYPDSTSPQPPFNRSHSLHCSPPRGMHSLEPLARNTLSPAGIVLKGKERSPPPIHRHRDNARVHVPRPLPRVLATIRARSRCYCQTPAILPTHAPPYLQRHHRVEHIPPASFGNDCCTAPRSSRAR